MHIVSVIPIERGTPFDVLTYYSNDALATGTLVRVPLGKKFIYGFVTETSPLAEAKAFVKQAAFSLKKVKESVGHVPFFEQLVGALKDTGAATLTPVGAVASTVIPLAAFEYLSPEKLPSLSAPPIAKNGEKILLVEEKAVACFRTDRISAYKRIIRSSFASKKSVLFVAPTIRSLEYWKGILEKGIGRHVAILHSKASKKELRASFALIKQRELPIAVFATPGYSAIPLQRLGTIIAEDESSSLYRSSDRFAIDARIFLKHLAQRTGAGMVWGDILPRFETLKRCGADHLPRTFVPEALHIIPVTSHRSALPDEVMELIRHAEKKKRRLFIYTNRKGIAPITRCGDCGTVLACPSCGLPMALRLVRRGGDSERQFICLHCAATLPSDQTCENCGSWKLYPLAIGTESIRDAVKELVGEEAVITIDDDLTPDSKAVEEALKRAESLRFAVIIGTQKALPYLKKVHYCIIPFFDRILSTPSLYTSEQAVRLVMECDECASSGTIVCTRTPEFPLVRQLETHKINAIIHDELTLREELGYPPYGSLLKISLTVPDGYRAQVANEVNEFLYELESTQLPARRVSAGSMKVLLAWLIKVPTSYIEEEGQPLVLFLGSLRFPYKIEENPERL